MNASSLSILSGFAAAGVIAGLLVPAHAVLQIIAEVNGVTTPLCVDNAACDKNPATGIIQVGDGALDGVQVNGSIQTSTGTPARPGPGVLNTSSLSIINLTDETKTATVVVSDTDFKGPVASWATAGSGAWQDAVGSSITSSITLNWYNDPANAQGASTPTDTPGTLIDTFNNTATTFADSFHNNGVGSASDSVAVLDD